MGWPLPLQGRSFKEVFGPESMVERRPLLAEDGSCTGPVVEVIGFTCVAHPWDAPCQQHGGWGDTHEMMRCAIEMMEVEPGCDIRLLTTPSDEPASQEPEPRKTVDDVRAHRVHDGRFSASCVECDEVRTIKADGRRG